MIVVLALAAVLIYARRRCRALYCVAPDGFSSVDCAEATLQQTIKTGPLTDSAELIIREVAISRNQRTADVRIKLQGQFHNEQDQNVYIFIGQTPVDGTLTSYSLSSDAQYFKDLSYPVWNTIQIPHSNQIRIGVMSPQVSNYSPQVYIKDPVYADFVGSAAHLVLNSSGSEFSITIPFADYYNGIGRSAPDALSFTIASAKDYVGFIDQISISNLAVGETKQDSRKMLPPTLYPTLNYDSHSIKKLTVDHDDGGGAHIEFETVAEIQDWAQTDLHFFLVPYPATISRVRILDPSHTVALPFAWSFYCGVYSPNRIFCKASNAEDFTYDNGYAKRAELPPPTGVIFRQLGNARYSLELDPKTFSIAKGRGKAFALLMTAGRDGFGPTSCYGWNCSGLCSLLTTVVRF